MQLRFERGDELRREKRQLPAVYFRKIRLLFLRARSESLFIPIRSMQYLAIVDQDEIIFVDGQGPRIIELSWKNFSVGEVDDLNAPVAYECVIYQEKGAMAMKRLQGEFLKALNVLEERQPKPAGGTVTPLER